MEIGVRVESENTITGDVKHTASAHLTFVALDENKKPKEIMKVEPITDVQKNRYKAAEKRVMNRKKELYN